jgi:hypothetical protein
VKKLLKEYLKRKNLELKQEDFDNLLKKRTFYSVIEKNKLIGCFSVDVENNVAEVNYFFLKEDIAMKEIAIKLIEIGREKNARKLLGLFDIDKSIALRAIGFSEEGILKDHYMDGENMFLMSLKIAKKEKQVDLKRKLEEEGVEHDASEVLRNLPLKK